MRSINTVAAWRKDGVSFHIVRHGLPREEKAAIKKALANSPRSLQSAFKDWHCGYCTFSKNPIKWEKEYGGILRYTPVHGGITFRQGNTFGFDCNHADDYRDKKYSDIQWLKAECERMAEAIKTAAKYEGEWRRCSGPHARCSVLDRFHRELAGKNIDFVLTDNFGAMIDVLFGAMRFPQNTRTRMQVRAQNLSKISAHDLIIQRMELATRQLTKLI